MTFQKFIKEIEQYNSIKLHPRDISLLETNYKAGMPAWEAAERVKKGLRLNAYFLNMRAVNGDYRNICFYHQV